MRLATEPNAVPHSVNKFLLPHERQVITVHQHPAVLVLPVVYLLVGLGIAGFLSESIAHGSGTAVLVIWILWAVLLVWIGYKIFEWSENYFVLTSHRMVLTTGFLTRKVNMMPLAKVTDMSYQRTGPGRLFGYGEFIVESAGQDQALSNVRFLPHPDQLYLEVCSLIFKETDES
ncbi:MAG: PH domain-containing protein [Actinobacteria bacterium]|nr:PH domain-containing protein [Actinomycetota bacterium]